MVGEPVRYDVIVVGGGNAALCAALAARDAGADVVVLEKAPPSEQGGNCPYTGGGFRFVHEGIEDLRHMLPDLTDSEVGRISMAPYTSDDFREHFAAVTKGDSDPALIETLIANSRPTVEWMFEKGVRWELSGRTSRVGRSALGHPQQRRNERLGVGTRTGADADHSLPTGGRDHPV